MGFSCSVKGNFLREVISISKFMTAIKVFSSGSSWVFKSGEIFLSFYSNYHQSTYRVQSPVVFNQGEDFQGQLTIDPEILILFNQILSLSEDPQVSLTYYPEDNALEVSTNQIKSRISADTSASEGKDLDWGILDKKDFVSIPITPELETSLDTIQSLMSLNSKMNSSNFVIESERVVYANNICFYEALNPSESEMSYQVGVTQDNLQFLTQLVKSMGHLENFKPSFAVSTDNRFIYYENEDQSLKVLLANQANLVLPTEDDFERVSPKKSPENKICVINRTEFLKLLKILNICIKKDKDNFRYITLRSRILEGKNTLVMEYKKPNVKDISINTGILLEEGVKFLFSVSLEHMYSFLNSIKGNDYEIYYEDNKIGVLFYGEDCTFLLARAFILKDSE